MLHEQKLTYPGKIKEILEDRIEAGKITTECLPDVMLKLVTDIYERKYIRTERSSLKLVTDTLTCAS